MHANKKCKKSSGTYTTLKSAIEHCKLGKDCIVEDKEADNIGPFSICPDLADVVDSTEASSVFQRFGDTGISRYISNKLYIQ